MQRRATTFFLGAGKCGGCHSVQNDLAHIASKYDPVELQSRFLSPPSPDYPQGFSDARKPRAAIDVTLKLPSGKSVSGTLVDLDAFDVALIDSEGWYRSYPRAGAQLDIRDPLKAHREMLPHYSDRDMHNMLAYLETLK